ncbi:MAG: hypothetical protein AAGF32_03265 [Pseudomonadota bacterium]
MENMGGGGPPGIPLPLWSSRERADQLRVQRNKNRELVRLYRRQFELSRRTLLDLLDVQNELFTTKSAVVTEELISTFNTFRVLAAMGTLVDALSLPLPDEAVVDPGGWETTWEATVSE